MAFLLNESTPTVLNEKSIQIIVDECTCGKKYKIFKILSHIFWGLHKNFV